MKPRARQEGLVVRELGDEVVVYDLERHEAHCLNPSASAVFDRCDGATTVDNMVRVLRSELDPGIDEAWVGAALDHLLRAHLLEAMPVADAPAISAGRRKLLRRVGVGTALLLPAVVSMVAPTAAEAAGTCVPALPDGQCPTGTPQFTPCYTIDQTPPPCTKSCQADGSCA